MPNPGQLKLIASFDRQGMRRHQPNTTARPAKPAPPRAAGNRASGFGSAVLWGGSGFVVGAMFWHVIGFWDFMSHVVLGAPESRRSQAEASGWATQVITTPTPGRTTTKRTTVAANCTTMAIDRTRGVTASKPCPNILPTVPAAVAAKADRLAPFADPPADQSEVSAAAAGSAEPPAPNPAIETSSIKFTAPWLAEVQPAKPN